MTFKNPEPLASSERIPNSNPETIRVIPCLGWGAQEPESARSCPTLAELPLLPVPPVIVPKLEKQDAVEGQKCVRPTE